MADLPPARLLEVEPDAYHKLPGLSPSLGHAVVSTCPLKARDKYLRNLDAGQSDEEQEDEPEERVSSEKQSRLDAGNILHALLLGVGKRIEVIPADMLGKNGAISTKEAKAKRDAARAAGRVPVKEPKMALHERAAAEVRERLAAAGHLLEGTSEMAIEWWEPSAHGPVQCRTMLDHVVLADSAGRASAEPTWAQAFELKFPGDASPDRSERTADGLGYPMAAAARHNALNALFPSIAGRIEYRYLICEPFRPYAFWDPTPTGAFLEYGRRQWRAAVNAWASGIASGRWVSYHDDIFARQIDLPRWRKMQEGFADDE